MTRLVYFFVASLLPCVSPILKGIDPIISPDLLHTLASMGHGDLLVLADANFPSSSVAAANGAKLIHADGHSVPDLLKGILKLFPLDTQVEEPVCIVRWLLITKYEPIEPQLGKPLAELLFST